MSRISVIVPIFGCPEMLSQCLESIRRSKFCDFELIVSDDASPDADLVRASAEKWGATLIRSEKNCGCAAARNRGAAIASGDLLVFIDADVTIPPETLSRIVTAFDGDPPIDALFGSYDSEPEGRGMISSFRNLLHSHAHQRSSAEAATFWTGCGAIRHESFKRLGGFREGFQLEDVELGLRLREGGGRIRLDPEIRVKHHKRWNLLSMIWTDLAIRAIPWAGLVRKYGLPRELNFGMTDRAAAIASALIPASLVLALVYDPVHWIGFAFLIAAVAILQSPFLRFVARIRGWSYAARCIPLLVVYNLTCVLGFTAGIVRSILLKTAA